MALRDQITNFIQRILPSKPATTADLERDSGGGATKMVELFKLDRDRRSIVTESRKMYDEDPRVEGAIEAIARDCTTGGYQVVVSGGSQQADAQQVADDLLKRVKLNDRLYDWLRLTLRDGDTFLESGVDRDRLIQSITRKPTLQMNRNSNQADRFDDPKRAYWLADKMWVQTPGPDTLWFADWQITHARWAHDEGSKYGCPLFKSARRPYHRVREGENDMAIRRKTRAGMKYFHFLEDASAEDIDNYRRRNQAALSDPLAAIADFFSNKKGVVTTIQGDGNIGQIDDIKHHLETLATGSPYPLALLGYGADINRDILEQKLEQYDEAKQAISKWLIDQILRPVIELQWLLQGVFPGNLEYEIVWNQKKKLTAKVVKDAADAGNALKLLGIPMEIIVRLLEQLIPGIDAEEVMALIAEEEAERQRNQPDEINRMNNLGNVPDEDEDTEAEDLDPDEQAAAFARSMFVLDHLNY
jgi:hypothetical protein